MKNLDYVVEAVVLVGGIAFTVAAVLLGWGAVGLLGIVAAVWAIWALGREHVR